VLRRLNSLVVAAVESPGALLPVNAQPQSADANQKPDPEAKTAVILVNGFNGMGLHILLNVIRLFGSAFKNYIFIQIGVLDAGNFKGAQEVDGLKKEVSGSLDHYVSFVRKHGYYSEAISSIGVNIVDEVVRITPDITERFPNAVFFGGQLIFATDTVLSKIFHNYTVFALQKRLYREGVPFVILPIRV
jgi:hypothetical protein